MNTRKGDKGNKRTEADGEWREALAFCVTSVSRGGSSGPSRYSNLMMSPPSIHCLVGEGPSMTKYAGEQKTSWSDGVTQGGWENVPDVSYNKWGGWVGCVRAAGRSCEEGKVMIESVIPEGVMGSERDEGCRGRFRIYRGRKSQNLEEIKKGLT